jgi:hypothetical protein
MANRRRTSPKPDPLDLDRELDEMYSSAITRPNLGFLRVGQSPVPEKASSEIKLSIDRSSGGTTSVDERSIDASKFPTKFDSVADVPSTNHVGSMDSVSMDARPAGKWKLHRCSTVQDGHSSNEQLLYEMLWRSAKELNPDERLIAISREDMAKETQNLPVKITGSQIRPSTLSPLILHQMESHHKMLDQWMYRRCVNWDPPSERSTLLSILQPWLGFGASVAYKFQIAHPRRFCTSLFGTRPRN